MVYKKDESVDDIDDIIGGKKEEKAEKKETKPPKKRTVMAQDLKMGMETTEFKVLQNAQVVNNRVEVTVQNQTTKGTKKFAIDEEVELK